MSFKRNMTEKSEFMKVVRPLQTLVANCKNPLFESVAFTLKSHIEDGDLAAAIIIFWQGDSESINRYKNRTIDIYQFYDMSEIKKLTAKVTRLLKVKTIENLEKEFANETA